MNALAMTADGERKQVRRARPWMKSIGWVKDHSSSALLTVKVTFGGALYDAGSLGFRGTERT